MKYSIFTSNRNWYGCAAKPQSNKQTNKKHTNQPTNQQTNTSTNKQIKKQNETKQKKNKNKIKQNKTKPIFAISKAHNWQKLKKVIPLTTGKNRKRLFLSCYCHESYRAEEVGLKITILLEKL